MAEDPNLLFPKLLDRDYLLFHRLNGQKIYFLSELLVHEGNYLINVLALE
jgi:hypothetical protein